MTDRDEEHQTIDRRSVGELLLDADLTSRAALWDPDPELAQARVRTWGEVVEAAADLWAAIPDRASDPSMRRINGLAAALHRTHRRTQWPSAGLGDPHLEAVATSLSRAAELVRGRRHPTAPLSAAGHIDAEAARTRIMHVLYVAAHGVGVALERHARDLQHRLDAKERLAPGESLKLARDSKERIAAVERLAGSYLHTRWPAALAGEHRETTEIARLEQALARWDLQAHRSLAGTPAAANLARIARVQRDLAVAAGIISAAAASRGLLDPEYHSGRLRPAMAGLEQSWERLATDLAPMVGRQRRIEPELLLAANEVQAALREITHQHAGFASPEVMAARVDLSAATDSLHRGLTAAVDLAHVTREALEDPEFKVAARGAYAMAASSAQRSFAAWVDVGDLQYNRDTTLPQPVRATLIGHAQEIIGKAIAADSAGAALQPPNVAPRGQITKSGREHQDRDYALSARSAPVPAMGCDW